MRIKRPLKKSRVFESNLFSNVRVKFVDDKYNIIVEEYPNIRKIYFENNEFEKSELFLNTFMNNKNSEILQVGAMKMLVNIALQDNQYEKAIKLLENVSKTTSKNGLIELKILKVSILKSQGKKEKAKSLIEEIMLIEKLPRHLKQKSEELFGMM